MSEAKLCCNCLHCARWKTKDGIETHCDLNDKYLGYIQVMEENTDCKHWEKETKWDLQKEHDKQIRADAIDEVATRILMKANYFNIDTEDIEEFNENVEKVVYSVVDEMKEQKNE